MQNRKLNFGCGKDIKKYFINLDKVNLDGVDIVADIEKSLPFMDNCFGEIYCADVLEHVDNFMGLMRELHRITCADGIIKIMVPHLSFFAAYSDPTHKRFFGYHSFDYFTEEGDFNFYIELRFKIQKRKYIFIGLRIKSEC
jgi:predicted SAM-dependent methyltransferase